MAFDLFISHSRRDDLDGGVTKFIEKLNREFEQIHGRELKVFFDTSEAESWDEWRERVLPALRESRLFLAYVATSYIESDHTGWDLNEYLKREIAQGLAGDGIVVVDTVDWARWDEGTPKRKFFPRLTELSRRRSFDFRSEKPESLHQLASHIARLIRLIERSEDSLGNVDPFNPHFTGRSTEFQRIRETLADKGICVLSGPSGIGKTAIAVEYAHAFAGEYDGGRWQMTCQGERSLLQVLDSPRLYELSELRKQVSAHDKCCLLVLDEVTERDLPLLSEPFAEEFDWLDVMAISRLGERHFSQRERDGTLLTVEGLSEAEAIQLIESYQRRRADDLTSHPEVAQRIARVVAGFPLTIELAAASAMYSPTLRLEDFIDPLWQAKYQARSVTALLTQIVSLLSEAEISALRFVRRFDDRFELPGIQLELTRDFTEYRAEERPGYSSAWQTLLNDLFNLRLWQSTNEVDANGELLTARMHPMVQFSIEEIVRGAAPSSAVPRETAKPPASPPPARLRPRASPRPPSDRLKDFLERAKKPPDLENWDRVLARRGELDQIAKPKANPKPKPPTPHPLDDNVMFTVYRRKTIVPNKWYPLLAFAHLSERRPDAPFDEPHPVAEVKRQAHALLDRSIADFKESTQDSSHPIPRSGELMFKPSVPGIEFNPPSRTFKWEESVHREEFKMRATPELEGQMARGYLRVFLGPIIVAEVNLAFKVDSTAGAADTAPQLIDQARTFRKVFASYSHKDKAIVEHIEKLVRDTHLGLEYLRDVTKLRSGEVWDPALLQMIDNADVFQLFWSTNAMGSEYVRREYEHALARQLPDFVRPVYWEKPFPERPADGLPPEALKRLHFEVLSLSEPVRVPPGRPPLPELAPPPPPPASMAPPPPPIEWVAPLAPPPSPESVRALRHCPKCGRNFDEAELRYCLRCGYPLERVETFERSESGARLAREDSVSKSIPFERYTSPKSYAPPAPSADGWLRSSDSVTSGPSGSRSSPLMTIYALMLVGSTLLEVVLSLLYLVLRYSGRSSKIVLSLLIGCTIVFVINWTIALILWLRDR